MVSRFFELMTLPLKILKFRFFKFSCRTVQPEDLEKLNLKIFKGRVISSKNLETIKTCGIVYSRSSFLNIVLEISSSRFKLIFMMLHVSDHVTSNRSRDFLDVSRDLYSRFDYIALEF